MEVLAYSLEFEVADKLVTIISLMKSTCSVKDLYDIYYLATTFNFEGRKLQEAIYESLSMRAIPYEKDSISEIIRITDDVEFQKRWDDFCKGYLKYQLDLTIVINTVIDFLQGPYESLIKEDEFFKNWRFQEKIYI